MSWQKSAADMPEKGLPASMAATSGLTWTATPQLGEFQIQGRPIGRSYAPYVVAEISANHAGGIQHALDLIYAAKTTGCDAAKIQVYQPDLITLNSIAPPFIVRAGTWKGRALYDLYQEAQTPLEWLPALFEHAKNCGITLFSSAFDPADVDELERLGCPAYKIASFEIAHLQLIHYAARTKKPVIISTGMATQQEIAHALSVSQEYTDVALLHCVSGYPTPLQDTNLWRMAQLANTFYHPVIGFSDHTTGTIAATAATVAGAQILEKHMRLADVPSVDESFSITPDEMRQYVIASLTAWSATRVSRPVSEQASHQMRRSLFAVRPIARGEAFTLDNVRAIRPSDGMSPLMLGEIIGLTAKNDIAEGTPLTSALVFNGRTLYP